MCGGGGEGSGVCHQSLRFQGGEGEGRHRGPRGVHLGVRVNGGGWDGAWELTRGEAGLRGHLGLEVIVRGRESQAAGGLFQDLPHGVALLATLAIWEHRGGHGQAWNVYILTPASTLHHHTVQHLAHTMAE